MGDEGAVQRAAAHLPSPESALFTSLVEVEDESARGVGEGGYLSDLHWRMRGMEKDIISVEQGMETLGEAVALQVQAASRQRAAQRRTRAHQNFKLAAALFARSPNQAAPVSAAPPPAVLPPATLPPAGANAKPEEGEEVAPKPPPETAALPAPVWPSPATHEPSMPDLSLAGFPFVRPGSANKSSIPCTTLPGYPGPTSGWVPMPPRRSRRNGGGAVMVLAEDELALLDPAAALVAAVVAGGPERVKVPSLPRPGCFQPPREAIRVLWQPAHVSEVCSARRSAASRPLVQRPTSARQASAPPLVSRPPPQSHLPAARTPPTLSSGGGAAGRPHPRRWRSETQFGALGADRSETEVGWVRTGWSSSRVPAAALGCYAGPDPNRPWTAR